ncbi:uncharacterized protein EI90DRAFT_3035420 [Cantharellus anzutake]|uniref:uncharacterized protein n=1 Tax=Cantharellus anzutake TaxID=1750568 RepID=UPI00190889FB|nr:uncharacterized protein EI90DRAFT_3035420 [Cantharellus anzutake]KAF8340393.1 hypothetical protein EI90DRAFT_3035420 [Cantharellus anzutake]
MRVQIAIFFFHIYGRCVGDVARTADFPLSRHIRPPTSRSQWAGVWPTFSGRYSWPTRCGWYWRKCGSYCGV